MASLSDQVDNDPTIFTALEVVEHQLCQFAAPKTAAKQNREEGPIALSLECLGARKLPERPGLVRGQPVTQPNAEFLGSLDAANTSCHLRAQQTESSKPVLRPTEWE